jgi:cytidylate kinase
VACRVVSISRSLGAQGEQIGHLVAEQLGFRYVDTEILVRAAERAGVPVEAVEKVEQSTGVVTRIVENLRFITVPEVSGWLAAENILQNPSAEYQSLISRVIRQVADEGNVVIVAHAASIPLAGMPGLLRVFVTASPATRARRYVEQVGVGGRPASQVMRESDRERAAYLKRFYNVERELPTLYDLVVNTDVVPAAVAARSIAELAGRLE